MGSSQKVQQREQAKRVALDEEQRDAFLWALALLGEDRALRIYTTLYETWMRKKALGAMTPRWVDFRKETIVIPAMFTKAKKSDKVIDMTPRAAEAIRAQMGEVVDLDAPIFGHFDFHQEWDEERHGGLFGRALALAGIDRQGLTPHHHTRHSAATIGGGKPGASIAGMMAQAGWESAQMADKYLHPSLKDARRMTREAK